VQGVSYGVVDARQQNCFMNTLGSGNGPDTGSDESWTNELLPLGKRRELLERELRRVVANKRHAQSAPRQEGAERGGGDHPQADDTAGSERAG
jgi:hypothetical protein